jgi:hypothetical protein
LYGLWFIIINGCGWFMAWLWLNICDWIEIGGGGGCAGFMTGIGGAWLINCGGCWFMIVAGGWSFIIQTNKQTLTKMKKKKKNLKFLILIFKKKITIAIKTRFRRLKIGSRNPKKIDFLFDFLGFLNFRFIFILFLEIWRFRLSG